MNEIEIGGQKYRMDFIAGGVVKDADGNILDDSSHRGAQEKLQELGLPNLLDEENT